jgi:hypothetical protein
MAKKTIGKYGVEKIGITPGGRQYTTFKGKDGSKLTQVHNLDKSGKVYSKTPGMKNVLNKADNMRVVKRGPTKPAGKKK